MAQSYHRPAQARTHCSPRPPVPPLRRPPGGLDGDAIQAKAEGATRARPEMPAATGGGQPLPAPVRGKMERAFGHSFADVRVHSGSEAEAVGALAYTRGEHIHFQPDLYDPLSLGGQELLGHELTHVIQQRAGLVSAPQSKTDGATPINADVNLEAEADALGARAARGQAAVISGTESGLQRKSEGDAPIQCKGFFSKLFGSCLGGHEQETEEETQEEEPHGAPVAPPLTLADVPNFGKSEIQSPDNVNVYRKPDDVRAQFHAQFQQNVMGQLKEGESPEEMGKWRADYEKIMNLMMDKDQTEQHLAPLDAKVNAQAGPGKLGSAIDAQKQDFGFSTAKKVPLGILPGDRFLDYYKTGNVPSDPGAGLAHGERSHQLQWSAIMSKFHADMDAHQKSGSEGPAPWNHIPLELASKFQDERFGWLQGHLMDNPGNQTQLGYMHPDTVNHNMVDDAETRARLPHLSGEVGRGFQNAQQMAWDTNKIDPNKGLNDAYGKQLTDQGWRIASGNLPPDSHGVIKQYKEAIAPNDQQPDELPISERIRLQREKYGMG